MTNNESGELSERELEILRLVATGASNKEIAQTLFISANTVKVHLRNIFNKIGVTSRTEAAMHAVRIGLTETSRLRIDGDDDSSDAERSGEKIATAQQLTVSQAFLQRWGVVIMLVMILAALGIGILIAQLPVFEDEPLPTSVIQVNASPTAINRWQEHSGLPTARNALALAAYENHIYAIAGETTQGVSDVVERYELAANIWTTLHPKPLPVADVSAAVVGGKIYVPGGRLANGTVSDTLEAYDPAEDSWTTYASLPEPLGGYALVAYEGRIYLFGGWDGEDYVNSVFSYDPGTDQWTSRTPMPTARGYSGAAISGGQIFVIGGTNGNEALISCEIYNPVRDNGDDNPWQSGIPLPEERFAMGISNATDLIYLIGGRGKQSEENAIFVYSPTTADWQVVASAIPPGWHGLAAVSVGQYLYMMGGMVDNSPSDLNLSYQAIYTVVLPFVP